MIGCSRWLLRQESRRRAEETRLNKLLTIVDNQENPLNHTMDHQHHYLKHTGPTEPSFPPQQTTRVIIFTVLGQQNHHLHQTETPGKSSPLHWTTRKTLFTTHCITRTAISSTLDQQNHYLYRTGPAGPSCPWQKKCWYLLVLSLSLWKSIRIIVIFQ